MTLPVSETPTPLQVGSVVTVTISDIAFGGAGVGRWDGLAIFVPFVAVGERVEAEIVEKKKNFARAKLLRVLEPSPDRVDPVCPYFTRCGGCQYQHLSYAAQLPMKHKQIADLMQRIGGFDGALVHSLVPCPSPFGYRNRIMVRTQWSNDLDRMMVGFLEAESNWAVEVEACPIAEPELNTQLQRVRENPPPKSGTKAVLRIPPDGWELPNDSFFQNNFLLLPGLVRTVRERFVDSGCRFLIDAYCGVGFFSVEMGDLCEEFAGVEIDGMAIRAAKKNAANRGLANGDYHHGSAEALLPRLIGRYSPEKTTVILDPPRAGCDPQSIKLLREVGPAQVIYVSCHPATLARDLKLLCADGAFRLHGITPLDMFPQTQHVECVADVRRV
jgi:tRNA/tmRNA/rRNA uracil-C5-methylase (TrmA/RlmC/RlmD family)